MPAGGSWGRHLGGSLELVHFLGCVVDVLMCALWRVPVLTSSWMGQIYDICLGWRGMRTV